VAWYRVVIHFDRSLSVNEKYAIPEKDYRSVFGRLYCRIGDDSIQLLTILPASSEGEAVGKAERILHLARWLFHDVCELPTITEIIDAPKPSIRLTINERGLELGINW